MIIKNFTILLSMTLISSCSLNTSELSFMVNFPKSSPILTKTQKEELKKNIAIKNTSLFTEEEKRELLGEIEVIIK